MKIELAKVEAEAIPLIYAYRTDPLTLRHNPVKPLTLEEITANMHTATHDWAEFPGKKNSFYWVAKVNGQMVGNCSLQNINLQMLTADMGYGVFAEHRGRGLGAEIARELARQAFSHSPLRRLVAYVHVENIASCRSLEKAGFVREGVLREHYIINGQPSDEAVYGILHSEIA